MRWRRNHHEPEHGPADRPDGAELDAVAAVAPLVWEGRLPSVSSPPVRIAARRAADLAADAALPAPAPTPHAAPDAA